MSILKILAIVASVGILAGCATGPYDTSSVRTEIRISSGYYYPFHNGTVRFYAYTYPNWYVGPYYRQRLYRYQPYYYAPPPHVKPREYEYPKRFVRPEKQQHQHQR
jgi:hypothetical protein